MDMVSFNVKATGLISLGLCGLLLYEMATDKQGQGSCIVGFFIVFFIHEYFKKKYFEKYPDKRPG